MKTIKTLPALIFALCTSQALAWSNHTIFSLRALERMPEVAHAAPVKAEPLESFLRAQEKNVEALLDQQEKWAALHVDSHAKRPESLRFTADPTRSDAARRQAFLRAMRVSPSSRFALYYQPDPGQALPAGTHILAYDDVNALPQGSEKARFRFVALKPGEMVHPLTVITSASDEPDYGIDLNLWADSQTEWGQAYNFGKQPFGNPALSYASQAPFHMGFFHESGILYAAAPFIKRTYPLYRAHQYLSLSTLAFRTGHDYWGWRFAGLSLHYIQDLTMPYHARLAPGVSTARLIASNALAMIGIARFKDDVVVLLSNRHTAMERYQLQKSLAGTRDPTTDPWEKALADTSKDSHYPDWSDRYVRDVVAKQGAGAGEWLSDLIARSLPAQYVNDPKYVFGAQGTRMDLLDVMSKADPMTREAFDKGLAVLLGNYGAHTRNTLRSLLRATDQR